MPQTHAEATSTIAADAGRLYDLVSDLAQMGRWSPEATGGTWRSGATGPALGAKFRGSNKAGWRRWSTTVTVTAADPGKRFAFHVSFVGVPIADWSYDFLPDEQATKVIEHWADRRPGWMAAISVPVLGVADRQEHNERSMQVTLGELKREAEAAPTQNR